MNWLKSVGYFELSIAGIFLLLYILFFTRYYFLKRQLSVSFKQLFLKFFIRVAALSLIIIALLGPSFGEMKKEVKSIGKDIILAVDLSNSMNAYDVAPSRLERMKFEMKNIVKSFSTDRIGLIIFASDAFVQCPLTFDQGALGIFTETLNTGLVTSGGTDFYPPLKLSLQKLLQKDTFSVTEKAKVIILISDGEDFGEETEAIAREIENKNIKLFTLGIGTEKGSRIPVGNGRFKTDMEGNEVNSTLNSDALKKLAKITDGKYFEISDIKNEVPKLIASINTIEGEVRDSTKIDVSANKYTFFLLGALLLLVLDYLLKLRPVRI
jgi:Ca-activated chloride channel homolog